MSAFKTIFTEMVNNGGDFAKLSNEYTKQSIKVFVKETSPYFLVSDSFFFVPAYFTKAALDEYEKKFANVKVQDLQEKVILINKWSLELKRVDSNAVFTSYAGLEVRLIVQSFKPQLGESLHPTRWPTNLYRDDEFKTTIQALRHKSVQEAAAKLPVPEVPLFGKGDVSQGVVAGKGDDWSFKEGATPVITIGGAKKPAPKAAGGAKVQGAAVKRVAKAVSKMAGDKKAAMKDKMPATAKVADKVMKFTPKKAVKGKQSVPKAKPAASPAAKKSAPGTTDLQTISTLKKFIKYQKGNAAAKKPAKK